MDYRELLEKEIARVQNKLGSLTPGTEQYQTLINELKELSKLYESDYKLELEKLDSYAKRDEADAKIEQAKLDSERNHEIEMAKVKTERANAEKAAQTQKKSDILGLTKTVVAGGIALLTVVATIYCEETRIITSKGWQIATKLLPKL